MANRTPCTLFGKKMKIAMVEQDIPQQELARCLGVASSTISDVIYSRNQCEHIKEHIAGTLGIQGQIESPKPQSKKQSSYG